MTPAVASIVVRGIDGPIRGQGRGRVAAGCRTGRPAASRRRHLDARNTVSFPTPAGVPAVMARLARFDAVAPLYEGPGSAVRRESQVRQMKTGPVSSVGRASPW